MEAPKESAILTLSEVLPEWGVEVADVSSFLVTVEV